MAENTIYKTKTVCTICMWDIFFIYVCETTETTDYDDYNNYDNDSYRIVKCTIYKHNTRYRIYNLVKCRLSIRTYPDTDNWDEKNYRKVP